MVQIITITFNLLHLPSFPSPLIKHANELPTIINDFNHAVLVRDTQLHFFRKRAYNSLKSATSGQDKRYLQLLTIKNNCLPTRTRVGINCGREICNNNNKMPLRKVSPRF